jgi:1-acyl-sn-glycerol-3-phosphate acyltransferase
MRAYSPAMTAERGPNAFSNAIRAGLLGLWCMFWMSLAALVSVFHGEWPLVLGRRFWAPGVLRICGIELEVLPGAELDPHAPYVFVMNHQSLLDVPVAMVAVPRLLRFVAKRSLGKVPFLSIYMRRTKMILIDRGRASEAYRDLRRAAEQIRKGISVLVYPEGTRSKTGQIGPFRKGPFLMARAAGVPVVPVVIDGSARVLPSGSFRLQARKIRVRVGAPISTSGFEDSSGGIAELETLVHAQVVQLHRALQEPASVDATDAPPIVFAEGVGAA